MSGDVTDELFPEPEEQPETEEQAEQPEPEAEAEAEQPETDGEGEQEGEPPAPEKEPDNHVPVSALKDERAKRQALQQQLDEMKRWRSEIEARANEHRLSQIEDPDQRMQAYQQQWQQSAATQKLEMSRRYAERQHGAEFVGKVVEFFNDPAHMAMSHQFLQSDDPFGTAVEYYNAQQALAEIGTDPSSYKERLREELRAELMAELSPTKPKTPPPSMASAPSSGGNHPPVKSGFDSLFDEG